MTPQQQERARLIRRARRHRRHMIGAAAALSGRHLPLDHAPGFARSMGVALPLVAFAGSALVVAVAVRRARLPLLALVLDVAAGAWRIWSTLDNASRAPRERAISVPAARDR